MSTMQTVAQSLEATGYPVTRVSREHLPGKGERSILVQGIGVGSTSSFRASPVSTRMISVDVMVSDSRKEKERGILALDVVTREVIAQLRKTKGFMQIVSDLELQVSTDAQGRREPGQFLHRRALTVLFREDTSYRDVAE